jgi:hypothetical protein
MLTRREVIGAGLAVGATDSGTVQQAADPRLLAQIVQHLDEIVTELRTANRGCSTGDCPTVDKLRGAMIQFLRANAKFPDALEVGPGVFLDIYDWHVRNRVTPVMARGADGRYTLGFLFTRLQLRTDTQPDYVGVPYDLRA